MPRSTSWSNGVSKTQQGRAGDRKTSQGAVSVGPWDPLGFLVEQHKHLFILSHHLDLMNQTKAYKRG